jgi:hypothetical protein
VLAFAAERAVQRILRIDVANLAHSEPRKDAIHRARYPQEKPRAGTFPLPRDRPSQLGFPSTE